MRIISCTALLLILTACQIQPVNKQASIVYAVVETEVVSSAGDAADDPAIWLNKTEPEKSLLLGTDKKRGLAVYNLAGQQVQFLERGRLNNVDLRSGASFNDGFKTIAVATNRTNNSIDIFSINAAGLVEHIYEQSVSLDDPYGICMFLDKRAQVYAFANGKNGEYQQWLLNPAGELKPQLIGSFKLNSQPEGCAVDDVTATLYLGEEEVGIWTMPADARQADKLSSIAKVGQGQVTADVEGMDVYRNQQGQVYLIVSSQGDNSYAVYDLNNNNAYLGSIRVADNSALDIDGSEETDGLAVSSAYLDERFPKGLLVVQDGFNKKPADRQNFKLISWESVEETLGL